MKWAAILLFISFSAFTCRGQAEKDAPNPFRFSSQYTSQVFSTKYTKYCDRNIKTRNEAPLKIDGEIHCDERRHHPSNQYRFLIYGAIFQDTIRSRESKNYCR